MRSMTGYGVGRASDETLTVLAEVRSVNNRFLEVGFRIPRMLLHYEPQIRDLVGKFIYRGRISISISEEWKDERANEFKLDRSKVLHYTRLLRELAQVSGINDEPRLEHLLQWGDFIAPGGEKLYEEQLWSLAHQALEEALHNVVETRCREGERIKQDLLERLGRLETELNSIEQWAKDQVKDYYQRLRQKLGELLEDTRLDPLRLETELALAAERLDISEELTRLKSHLSEFYRLLNLQDPVGKSLNFLLQEMVREVTTVNSKAFSIEITRSGIQIKKILEELREQIQNIE